MLFNAQLALTSIFVSNCMAPPFPGPSLPVKLTNGHDHSGPEVDDPSTSSNPVIGGIWNQDLFFLSKSPASGSEGPPKKGCKVMKPR